MYSIHPSIHPSCPHSNYVTIDINISRYLSTFTFYSMHTHARTHTRTQQQIKLGWALFVTYTIIQSIMRSEMCSLHLTHPSVHTWSSGQPTVQRPGSSHGLPFGAGIRTHNLGLPRVSSPTLYPLGQRLPSACTRTRAHDFRLISTTFTFRFNIFKK